MSFPSVNGHYCTIFFFIFVKNEEATQENKIKFDKADLRKKRMINFVGRPTLVLKELFASLCKAEETEQISVSEKGRIE